LVLGLDRVLVKDRMCCWVLGKGSVVRVLDRICGLVLDRGESRGRQPPHSGIELHLIPDADEPRLKKHSAVARRELFLVLDEVVVRSLPDVFWEGSRHDEGGSWNVIRVLDIGSWVADELARGGNKEPAK
jgi:hypothetical protein